MIKKSSVLFNSSFPSAGAGQFLAVWPQGGLHDVPQRLREGGGRPYAQLSAQHFQREADRWRQAGPGRQPEPRRLHRSALRAGDGPPAAEPDAAESAARGEQRIEKVKGSTSWSS